MNPGKLKKYVAELKAERERLLEQISRLEETGIGDTMADSLGELSVYDNHPADIGSELFERSKDIGLRDNEHVLLESVEHALAKVKNGSYGQCDNCGQPIDEERLAAIPWASQCLKCQQQQDDRDITPRPIEEQLLERPFNRTFLDNDRSEYAGFDGEDAWQAVARYGTSETPQDIFQAEDYDHLFVNSEEHAGIVDPADAIPNSAATSADTRKRKPSKS